MPRRKKEDKTIELIIAVSVMIGVYIALTHTGKPETIEQGVIRVIFTIFTTLIVLTAVTVTGMIVFRYMYRLRLGNKELQLPPSPFDTSTKKEFTDVQPKEFLSPAEKEFKEYLRQRLPEDIEIHCKVRLADILKTETKYRKIIMMHIDFVLLDANTQKVMLAIELDDKSHDTAKAKERDAIKNEALYKSGIKLIRVPNSDKYHPALIKKIIEYCKSITSPDSSC